MKLVIECENCESGSYELGNLRKEKISEGFMKFSCPKFNLCLEDFSYPID